MASSPIPITPSVMRWARQQAGYSSPEASATKIGRPASEITDWENGTASPTLAQLRKACEVYRRPFAVFFLAEPPQDFQTLRDFRTLVDSPENVDYGPVLTQCIHEAQERQAWLQDVRREDGMDRLDFVGSAKTTTSPSSVASHIRHQLGIADDWAASIKTRDDALRFWVRKAEASQIVVFQDGTKVGRKIGLREARGFILTDAWAPVIFLNKHDGYAARLFTLAHELAHLWINEPGVSNLDFRAGPKLDPVELFCNRVAAETLVPADLAREQATIALRTMDLDAAIQQLADQFKVSEMAMVRRIHDLGLISRSAWLEHHAMLADRYARRKQRDPDEKSGGNPHTTKAYDLGKLFLGEVLHRYAAGSLMGSEAASLTGWKVDHLPKIAAKAHIPLTRSMELA